MNEAFYIEENERILHTQVFPAYEFLITELTLLQDKGTNELGLCHYNHGREYYQLLVYSGTGCKDSVDDIFNNIEAQRADDLLICAKLQEKDRPYLGLQRPPLLW